MLSKWFSTQACYPARMRSIWCQLPFFYFFFLLNWTTEILFVFIYLKVFFSSLMKYSFKFFKLVKIFSNCQACLHLALIFTSSNLTLSKVTFLLSSKVTNNHNIFFSFILRYELKTFFLAEQPSWEWQVKQKKNYANVKN